jgi:hypothetical protein
MTARAEEKQYMKKERYKQQIHKSKSKYQRRSREQFHGEARRRMVYWIVFFCYCIKEKHSNQIKKR